MEQKVKQLEKEAVELKQAEDALRNSEVRFQQIAENALEWIWEVDTNGLYTYASPVVERILGYTPEEIVGQKHFYDFFHLENKKQLKKAAFEVFAKKESFREFINCNIHKNGDTVWLSTSGIPLLDEQGNLLGYRGADTDITDKKQAEEALSKRAEEFAALYETSLDITRPHVLSSLLETIVERAAQLLTCPSGGMYLCDPDRKEVCCVVSYKTSQDYTGTVLKYGEGASGVVAQTKEPLIIDDYRIWSKRAAVYDKDQPFTSVISVPMIRQDDVIGV